jgi:signal transduction histidine kinase
MTETYHRIICIAPDGASAATAHRVLAAALPDAVVGELASSTANPPGTTNTLDGELRRVQRAVAVGERSAHWQHTLNNPLAALLAESQLLEMEPLPPDHQESVRRIVELCRRLIELVRASGAE